MHSSQFGASVRDIDEEAFRKSDNWDGSKFQNLASTKMDISLASMPGLIVESFKGRKERGPSTTIPVTPFSPKAWTDAPGPLFCWYGHSALFLRTAGMNILIDPMLGDDASPIGPIRTRRYSRNVLAVIDELPAIDAVLLTHDHYDHLDYTSVQRLAPKVGRWFVGLGISRHLESWGIDAADIQQFDWWDETHLGDLHITYTPSQHFSGRGLLDRAKSLWGGWVINSPQSRIYWSGDSGYRQHFKEVGRRLGPFDIAFVECGQYNERWHAIHMYPEEAVQAAIDSGSRLAVPVHWGAFTLALHHWKDPIQRFVKAAKAEQLAISTPHIGEIFDGTSPKTEYWWENMT